jgi:hypothetical protein
MAREIPCYADVVRNGVGFYLRDPGQAPAGRVVHE